MHSWHKVRATVPGYDNRAGRIAQAGRPFPAPLFQGAVNETAGEGIPCTECVIHLDGKWIGIDNFSIRQMNVCPLQPRVSSPEPLDHHSKLFQLLRLRRLRYLG